LSVSASDKRQKLCYLIKVGDTLLSLPAISFPGGLVNLRKLSLSSFVFVLFVQLLPINITKLMCACFSLCGWNWVASNWLPSRQPQSLL